MTREELEIEYSAAWEALQQARMNVQFAQKNFHDVCGLLMEKLMLENVVPEILEFSHWVNIAEEISGGITPEQLKAEIENVGSQSL